MIKPPGVFSNQKDRAINRESEKREPAWETRGDIGREVGQMSGGGEDSKDKKTG